MRTAIIGSLVSPAGGTVSAQADPALAARAESDRGGRPGLCRNAPGCSGAKEPWAGGVCRASLLAGMASQRSPPSGTSAGYLVYCPPMPGNERFRCARKANPRRALPAVKAPVVAFCSRRVGEATRQMALGIA